jgi:uncharacterized protein with HEPN domain
VRSDRERLNDIRDAIAQIEKYTANGRARFDSDELVQTWALHRLMIIGEASRGLSAEFRDAHPETQWAQIIGMRNFLIHAYFGVDPEEVWATVERDLPPLKQAVNEMLKALDEASAEER